MKLKINQHHILPPVLKYLLSINVTMLNSEQNFTKLKKVYNDCTSKFIYEITTAVTELTIFNTMKLFNLELSINKIQNL